MHSAFPVLHFQSFWPNPLSFSLSVSRFLLSPSGSLHFLYHSFLNSIQPLVYCLLIRYASPEDYTGRHRGCVCGEGVIRVYLLFDSTASCLLGHFLDPGVLSAVNTLIPLSLTWAWHVNPTDLWTEGVLRKARPCRGTVRKYLIMQDWISEN